MLEALSELWESLGVYLLSGWGKVATLFIFHKMVGICSFPAAARERGVWKIADIQLVLLEQFLHNMVFPLKLLVNSFVLFGVKLIRGLE